MSKSKIVRITDVQTAKRELERRSQKHRRNFNYKLWPLASTKKQNPCLQMSQFFSNALLLRTDSNRYIYLVFKLLFLMLTSNTFMIWKSKTTAKCGSPLTHFTTFFFLRFFFVCLCKFQNLIENTA